MLGHVANWQGVGIGSASYGGARITGGQFYTGVAGQNQRGLRPNVGNVINLGAAQISSGASMSRFSNLW